MARINWSRTRRFSASERVAPGKPFFHWNTGKRREDRTIQQVQYESLAHRKHIRVTLPKLKFMEDAE